MKRQRAAILALVLLLPLAYFLSLYTPVYGQTAQIRIRTLGINETITALVDGSPTTIAPNSTLVYNWDVNSTHIVQVPQNQTSSPGTRYFFLSWPEPGESTPTLTVSVSDNSSRTFTALYRKEHTLTLLFVDTNNEPVSPEPSSVLLTSSTGLPKTLLSYTNEWVPEGEYTVSAVSWQSINVVRTYSAISLTGPTTTTLTLRIYTARVQVTDENSRLVQGVAVSVTLANGTGASRITDSSGIADFGKVPLGLFTANVTFNGRTITSSWDAKDGTLIIPVQGPGQNISYPLGTLIVAVALVSVALFVVFLLVKLRNPPSAPKI